MNFSYDWSLETQQVTFTNNNICDSLFIWATSTPLCSSCENEIVNISKLVAPGEVLMMDAGLPASLSWKPDVIYSLANGETYKYHAPQAGSYAGSNSGILLLDFSDQYHGIVDEYADMFSIGTGETRYGDCENFSWIDRENGDYQITTSYPNKMALCYVGNIQGYTTSGDSVYLPPVLYFVTDTQP